MTFLATGNAMEALIDAAIPALRADAQLSALIAGVYTKVPQAQRTAHPYVRLSDPSLTDDFGGMGVGGGTVRFALDVWGRKPHTVHAVLARAKVVLDRADLVLVNHRLAGGSLHCADEVVFTEPDPDKPEETLFHGHQAWEALVEEA